MSEKFEEMQPHQPSLEHLRPRRHGAFWRSVDRDAVVMREAQGAGLGRIALESLRDRREELTAATIRERQGVAPEGHLNTVYLVALDSDRYGYLKPELEEAIDVRETSIPQLSQWRREVAACEVDRSLDFGLVPDTVAISETEGDLGHSSLQSAVPFEGKAYEAYSMVDQQRMAVLDYLLANTDRHCLNYMTSALGRPAAIDNGLCLPEDDHSPMRSEWVRRSFGTPLDPLVMHEVMTCDEKTLVGKLATLGISEAAIAGFSARLDEVRTKGCIDGSGWNGAIYGEDFFEDKRVRGATDY